jgi:hypothetical protein
MMGSIEVKILIRLNQDITPEQAKEFVNEMEYTIKDTTGKVSIAETEVIDSNVDSEEEYLSHDSDDGGDGELGDDEFECMKCHKVFDVDDSVKVGGIVDGELYCPECSNELIP